MFKPRSHIASALLPAGSLSAASLSRANAPAPILPRGGTGTPYFGRPARALSGSMAAGAPAADPVPSIQSSGGAGSSFEFEQVTPSAGSHSAALLPRAETPAPHRPLAGAGNPSLLAAALERRTLHPLVEEVKVGPPRVFIYCASTEQRRPRRRRFGWVAASVAHGIAGAVAMALFLTAFFTLLAVSTLPTTPSALALQAEARP